MSGFRVLVAVTACAGLFWSRPGLGADSAPVPAPSAFETSFLWGGAYVGGHLAYSGGIANVVLTDPFPIRSRNSFGSLFGGLQVGYNYLVTPRVLLGVEADVSFPNFLGYDDVSQSRPTALGVAAEKHDYVATLRGRLGHLVGSALVYGTAGLAWSQVRFSETPALTKPEDIILRSRFGWTAGLGVEVPVAENWTARLEYLHHSFGRSSAVFASGAQSSSTLNSHTARIGLNWHPGAATGGASRFSDPLRPVVDPENWNVHGQFTSVTQGYPSFRSPYSGENSLSGRSQIRTTLSATAFVGVRLWQGAEFYINPELMQGFGFNDVHGVAGFPNGEAQKSSFPTPRLNVARMFIRQTIGLGGEQETLPDGPNQLAGRVDISRITITAGKFAVTDLFSTNAVSGEPRTGFLNWNIYGGGSYDWTMDKLSWTWGAVVELNQKHWAFRTGYFLLPTISNSNNFDTRIPQRGQYTAEFEYRYSLFDQPGKLRLFAWLNRGNMGGYLDALVLSPVSPDVTLTRRERTNYGFVANLEQSITPDLSIFSRATWSPGKTELIGWTDASQTLSLGAVMKGTAWSRPNDRIGLATVIQGLSREQRAYFAAGGMGILIGDGQLNYRREQVMEAYYAIGLDRFSTLTFDYQFINNPGYNADRGPVSVFTTRFHAEF